MTDEDLPPYLRQQTILPEVPLMIPEQEELPPREEDEVQKERPVDPFLRRGMECGGRAAALI
jgi:hypothetical protein